MSQPFTLAPIGREGLPALLAFLQRLNAGDAAREANLLWDAALKDHDLLEHFLHRESVDLSLSLFAWPAGSTPVTQPAGFALLGVRRAGGQVRCSVRALAGGQSQPATQHPVGTQPSAAGSTPAPGDPRPALLQAMTRAARELGATDISAEAALDPADHPARPSASLLRDAGFEQVDVLLSYAADAATVLAEPVYLQTGLQEVDPSEVVDWLSTIPAVLPPWPAQAESIARLRFPDVTYLLVASGTAVGYLAVTDPHLQEVYVLQIGVLADLRRQQIAVGGLQELLTSHDRIRTLHVPPLVREGDRELRAFLEATGFLPAGLRRAEMVLRLNR